MSKEYQSVEGCQEIEREDDFFDFDKKLRECLTESV